MDVVFLPAFSVCSGLAFCFESFVGDLSFFFFFFSRSRISWARRRKPSFILAAIVAEEPYVGAPAALGAVDSNRDGAPRRPVLARADSAATTSLTTAEMGRGEELSNSAFHMFTSALCRSMRALREPAVGRPYSTRALRSLVSLRRL